jgi:hypothetical protein
VRHKVVAEFYEARKVTTVICHATCILPRTRLSDGKLLVEGKTWTGFANSEEEFADAYVGRRIQPFWIEDEAKKVAHTNFIVNGHFKPHPVRDGYLITGQQQHSGTAAARLDRGARRVTLTAVSRQDPGSYICSPPTGGLAKDEQRTCAESTASDRALPSLLSPRRSQCHANPTANPWTLFQI